MTFPVCLKFYSFRKQNLLVMHTLKGDWILIQDFYCWVHDIGSAKHKLKRMPSYPGLVSLNSICHI